MQGCIQGNLKGTNSYEITICSLVVNLLVWPTLRPWRWGSTFLWNVGKLLPDYTGSHTLPVSVHLLSPANSRIESWPVPRLKTNSRAHLLLGRSMSRLATKRQKHACHGKRSWNIPCKYLCNLFWHYCISCTIRFLQWGKVTIFRTGA
jgi:hypothetical protein